MKKEFYYISETSNRSKIRTFIATAVFLIILAGSVFALINTFDKLVLDFSSLNLIKRVVTDEIWSFSPTGLFYMGFGGGLFFVPFPQEAFFYYGLLKGNPIVISLLTVNAGFLLAQGVNYFVGSKLNKYFLQLVSKRKLYKARRFINRHGGKGVFLFNLLPLPAPLLTFALGIAKYNVYRLFFYLLLGTALKYTVIVLFFIAVN